MNPCETFITVLLLLMFLILEKEFSLFTYTLDVLACFGAEKYGAFKSRACNSILASSGLFWIVPHLVEGVTNI